jgi:hypothetical protein
MWDADVEDGRWCVHVHVSKKTKTKTKTVQVAGLSSLRVSEMLELACAVVVCVGI